jgi:cleavage stimulation factor subunit 3
VYHRAIETPMHNLESIWKEYDAFENELNKVLAKGLLNEHAPKYMNARSIYRERKRYCEGILRNMLAKPPSLNDKDQHSLQVRF